jgi:putative ABC transport system permease protein
MQIQIGIEVEKYGPNIVVLPKSESISVPYGNVVVGDVTIPESHLEKIYSIPNSENLRIVSPKLYGQVEYENLSLFIVGINPAQEDELKVWWNIEGFLPQDDSNQILIGSSANAVVDLSIRSTISFGNMTLEVVGILSETGSLDDYSLFLPLHTAQRLLDQPGVISSIDVGALCSACPVEVMAQQIMDALPNVKATPILQAVETRTNAIEQTVRFSMFLSSIILIAGSAGIMNTMLASVQERIREIGILMSLGADNVHLYKLFFIESLILGLIGGTLGCIIGLVSVLFISPLLTNTSIIFWQIPIPIIPLSIALSCAVSISASLYPSWRASKIDPVKALRSV